MHCICQRCLSCSFIHIKGPIVTVLLSWVSDPDPECQRDIK